jgi:small ligand-binding sensory domain FIST
MLLARAAHQPGEKMPFASALSIEPDSLRAVQEVCERARAQLPGTPDCALLFFSPHHAEAAAALGKAAAEQLGARCFLGCPGESIVADDREIERGPALSLWLAQWPVAELTPFHLTLEETSEGLTLLGWPDDMASVDPERAVMLLLADPFSFPVDDFLRQMNEQYPGLRVLGGMASGAREPGGNPLLLGHECLAEGAIGVLLQGAVQVRSVVSQGCRPIGQHLVVTKAQDNIIIELGGKSPLAHLQQLWQELSPRDQRLMQQGLHIGRVINEYQGEFQRGDFLVRNVMGLDRASGALAVTDRVRVGQTMQFHVRDAATADEDLHELLHAEMAAHKARPAGALLFTCNGRGSRLFDQPDHDASVVRAEVGPVPLAGFFAQGELGPVGGQNFIHGFTASVVLFEDM